MCVCVCVCVCVWGSERKSARERERERERVGEIGGRREREARKSVCVRVVVLEHESEQSAEPLSRAACRKAASTFSLLTFF